MLRNLKVYCLAPFTEDEIDKILTQLDEDSRDCYFASDIYLDLIPWTHDQHGGKDDILDTLLETRGTEEDFMFFIDKDSLHLQDFLVADVRAAKKVKSSSRAPTSEVTIGHPASSEGISPAVPIPLARCESPYSGIKKTYMSLVSGQITLDHIVHGTEVGRNRVDDTQRISSVLDLCEEEYSAQVRSAQQQAEQLCRELEAKSDANESTESRHSNDQGESHDHFHSPSLQRVLLA